MTPGDLNNPIQVCVADENGIFIPLFTAWVNVKNVERRCVYSTAGVGSRQALELVAYKYSKIERATPFIYSGNWYVISGTNDIDSTFMKLTAGRADMKELTLSAMETTVNDKNVVTGSCSVKKTVSAFLLQKYINVKEEESHSVNTQKAVIMVSPNAGVESGNCVKIDGESYAVGAKIPNTDTWDEFEIIRESDL